MNIIRKILLQHNAIRCRETKNCISSFCGLKPLTCSLYGISKETFTLNSVTDRSHHTKLPCKLSKPFWSSFALIYIITVMVDWALQNQLSIFWSSWPWSLLGEVQWTQSLLSALRHCLTMRHHNHSDPRVMSGSRVYMILQAPLWYPHGGSMIIGDPLSQSP